MRTTITKKICAQGGWLYRTEVSRNGPRALDLDKPHEKGRPNSGSPDSRDIGKKQVNWSYESPTKIRLDNLLVRIRR